jgi:uncharacterized protein YlxW (UPF0749 family)
MAKINIEDLGIEDTAGFKNLLAIRDYTKSTRELFRELEATVENLEKQLQNYKLKGEEQQKQIQALQIKLYSVKPTV